MLWSSPCRALSWGWFCFPMTPNQPCPHGAAWVLPALVAHILSCLHRALALGMPLALGTALAGAHTAAPSTPAPQLPMGPEPIVGLGAGRGLGPPLGRRLARQWPCVAASSPRCCILPVHPFPAGHHRQGHQHQAGPPTPGRQRCCSHPALFMMFPSSPGQRHILLPCFGAPAVSWRCRQGQDPTGRAY